MISIRIFRRETGMAFLLFVFATSTIHPGHLELISPSLDRSQPTTGTSCLSVSEFCPPVTLVVKVVYIQCMTGTVFQHEDISNLNADRALGQRCSSCAKGTHRRCETL